MSQLCSLGEKNYFFHIHILREIFENVKVITRVITRVITNSLECCHEVRIGKQNVHANKVYADMERQKNLYPSLQIVRPTSQRTPLSKFVIWFMTC